MLESQNVPTGQMPPAVAEWNFTPADAALPPAEKQRIARNLVFGQDYQNAVAQIMAPIEEFHTKLNNRLNEEVAASDRARTTDEMILAGSALLLALALGTFLFIINRFNGSVLKRYA